MLDHVCRLMVMINREKFNLIMSQIMDNYVSKVHENEKNLIIRSIIIGRGNIKSAEIEKILRI